MNKKDLNKLIKWSTNEFSHLPWRERRSLYHTLVSEIMLQQTTVSTVLNHFDRFLKVYPSVEALGKASEEDVCVEWKGLGYYRRARNLRNAAEQLLEEYDGEIPLDFQALKKIKGIGDYTANAILAMGADQKAIALDANLERVISRYYGIKEQKGPKLLKLIQKQFEAGEIFDGLGKISFREVNEALMDLGRVYCQARSAQCDLCPLSSSCAVVGKNPLEYPQQPVEAKKKQKYYDLKLLRVLVQSENGLYAYKKSESEWLTNQYEIPTFCLGSEDEKLIQYPRIIYKDFEKLPSFKTSITSYRITNYVVVLTEEEFKKKISKHPFDLEVLEISDKKNFSTASFKAMKKEKIL